ncbi:hypothetical protein C5689_05750 [Methylosinus sporium]|uniref:Uncharacterized protein n=1 Tax=Methylosinus sporium TaxID=428 RepID=A0A2U1STK3_METSR|nr:hypothetical protein C5689_05750 [Methylosinus sporium]
MKSTCVVFTPALKVCAADHVCGWPNCATKKAVVATFVELSEVNGVGAVGDCENALAPPHVVARVFVQIPFAHELENCVGD